MDGTNDCKAYINKLANIGTNYSFGKVLISASAGAYSNTNYYFDDTTWLAKSRFGLDASNSVVAAGASPASVIYSYHPEDLTISGHITNGVNVAGFFSFGIHGYPCDCADNAGYATNKSIVFSGNSTWYLLNTVESFNGMRYRYIQGTFMTWFSSNAFGGINYSNTPVGSISYPDEPGLNYVNKPNSYFGLWQGGKNFGICVWQSSLQQRIHAVGDPLVRR